MITKRHTRIFHIQINEFHYILYSNGLCRIDNECTFTTTHYTGTTRIDWWNLFFINYRKARIDYSACNKAFVAWIGHYEN